MTAPPATSGTSGQASLPELLVEQFLSKAQRAPGAVVIRQRTADLWHELTAGDVALAIRRVSRALLGAGVAAQDYVLVVGAASAEWLVAELACQSIGAASVVVADDAASATLPAEVADRVRAIALVDPDRRLHVRRRDAMAAIPGLGELPVLTVADIMRCDDEVPASRPAALGADGTCTVIRSTQTGVPVYTAVTYSAIDAAWRGLFADLGFSPRDRVTPATTTDFWVGRLFMLQLFAAAGVTFFFTPEGIADAQALREIRPTVWWATPRAWLRLTARVRAQVLGSGRVSRLAYGQFQPGQARGARSALSAIRSWLVMKPLLYQLGLNSVRICLVVGDKAPGPVERTLHQWGLRFTEVECPAGAAGPAGYRPAADAARTQQADTGSDAGWESDIESRIRQSDYVADAVAVAAAGGTMHVLLEPQLESLISWASENGISFPSVAALLEEADVGRLLAREVARHIAGAAVATPIGRIDVVPDFGAIEVDGECLYTESGTLRAGAVRRRVTGGDIIPSMRPILAEELARAENGVDQR
jgi:long-subunit acyl-CoA synthetase (AMP-forming)